MQTKNNKKTTNNTTPLQIKKPKKITKSLAKKSAPKTKNKTTTKKIIKFKSSSANKTVLIPKNNQIKKIMCTKCNISTRKKHDHSFLGMLKTYWNKFLCYFFCDYSSKQEKPIRGRNPKTLLKPSRSPVIK